jgi:uncharacterized membrane protein
MEQELDRSESRAKVIHHISRDGEVSTGRIEAFSDGVFAIAITLLILEIKVPSEATLEHTSLSHYLLEQWPKIFAYVFSFVIIGIYWANHHYLFKLFRKTDHWLNMINVFFLLSISFLPFPTAVFGEFMMDHESRPTAVTFYAIAILVPAVFYFAIWLYASRKRKLIDANLNPAFTATLTRKLLVSNIIYFVAILVSLVSPITAIIMNVVLTLVYLLPPQKPVYDD